MPHNRKQDEVENQSKIPIFFCSPHSVLGLFFSLSLFSFLLLSLFAFFLPRLLHLFLFFAFFHLSFFILFLSCSTLEFDCKVLDCVVITMVVIQVFLLVKVTTIVNYSIQQTDVRIVWAKHSTKPYKTMTIV